MTTIPAHIAELAAAIAGQAEAIANGTVVGPLEGAAGRLAQNVETLKAWVVQETAEAQAAAEAAERVAEAQAERKHLIITWMVASANGRVYHAHAECGQGNARAISSPVVLDDTQTDRRPCGRCVGRGFAEATPENIAKATEAYRRKLYHLHMGTGTTMPERFQGTDKGDRWTRRAVELDEWSAAQERHQLKRLAELAA